MINYQVIRSNRKTTAIKIVDSQVYVYTNFFVGNSQIVDFVKKHEAWISKKLANKRINLCFDLEKDNFIYLLGHKYYLDIQINTKNGILVDEDTIYLRGYSLNSIENSLKNYMNNLIEQEVQTIKRELNVDFNLQYRLLHSFWGNCNKTTKTIHLNTYLACVEQKALISVIYHEIAHLKYANHQKEFYDYLLKICPTYRQDNKLLKKYTITKN